MNGHIAKRGEEVVVLLDEPVELAEGTQVEIQVVEKQEFVDPTKYMTFEEMVATITPENRHELIDFGPPVGKEIW